MTKRVRFNAHGSFQMIPDEEYIKIQKISDEKGLRDMREQHSYHEATRYKFPWKDFYPGFEADVPDHYFEKFKDQITSVPISFDHYTDKETGLRSSFNMDESIRHRDITAEDAESIRKTSKITREVKLFELVDESEDQHKQDVVKSDKQEKKLKTFSGQ